MQAWRRQRVPRRRHSCPRSGASLGRGSRRCLRSFACPRATRRPRHGLRRRSRSVRSQTRTPSCGCCSTARPPGSLRCRTPEAVHFRSAGGLQRLRTRHRPRAVHSRPLHRRRQARSSVQPTRRQPALRLEQRPRCRPRRQLRTLSAIAAAAAAAAVAAAAPQDVGVERWSAGGGCGCGTASTRRPPSLRHLQRWLATRLVSIAC